MSLSMLNRSIASMAGRASGGSYDVQEYFWGAVLSKDKPTFKWNPQVEDEFRDEMQNILFLKRAVLGVSAAEGEKYDRGRMQEYGGRNGEASNPQSYFGPPRSLRCRTNLQADGGSHLFTRRRHGTHPSCGTTLPRNYP